MKETDLQTIHKNIATAKEELNAMNNFHAQMLTSRNDNLNSQGVWTTTSQDSSTFRRLQQYQNTFQSLSLTVYLFT